MKPGLRVTFDNAKKISRATRLALGVAVQETARGIETGAKQRAPVDTGFLQSSIGSSMITDSLAEIRVGAEYGAYVEFGTRSTPAKPYLTPAVSAEAGPFLARLKAAGLRGAKSA